MKINIFSKKTAEPELSGNMPLEAEQSKVIFFDAEKYDKIHADVDRVFPKLKSIYELFNNLAHRPITIQELQGLFQVNANGNLRPNMHPEELLLDMLIEYQEGMFFGAKLNKDVAKSLIQLPNMDSINAEIDELCFKAIPTAKEIPWNFFELTNGNFQVNKAELKAFKNRCRIFATTKKQKSRLNIAERLIKNIYSLEAETVEKGTNGIPGVITWDNYSEKYIPELSFIIDESEVKNRN